MIVLNGNTYDEADFLDYGYLDKFPTPIFTDMLAELSRATAVQGVSPGAAGGTLVSNGSAWVRSGLVLVGATNGGVDVTQTASTTACVIARPTNASYTGASIYSAATRAASAAFQHLYCESNGVRVHSVDGAGGAYFGGVVAVNAPVTTGASVGDVVVGNARGLRGVNAAGTNTVAMVDVVTASNAVRLAGDGNIVTVGPVASLTSASGGDLVLSNAKALRGVNAGGTDTLALLSLSASNRTQLALNSAELELLTPMTATTVGAAGGASALPATPVGYVVVRISGTNYKVPYYNT